MGHRPRTTLRVLLAAWLLVVGALGAVACEAQGDRPENPIYYQCTKGV